MSTGDHKPTVVLCGFMATGKTTAGRELASVLEVPFIDTDALVEERAGKSVSEIFSTDGEAAFRALEKEVCRSLAPTGGAVIATGGGMLIDADNFQHLASLGTMILLDASVDVILQRTGKPEARPLLHGHDTRQRVRALYDERASVYQRVPHSLDTTFRTIDETVHDLREVVDSNGRVIPLRVDTRPLPGRRAWEGNTRLCRVVVGPGASDQLGEWLQRLELLTEVRFLTPEKLQPLVLAPMQAALDECGVPWSVIHVDDGDDNKTLAQVSSLLDRLATEHTRRDSVIVAVGGGVTGDVAGFAASLYMRGLPLVQVPTTLLGQVDASIGGKTGVNTPRAKNLVGAMYQPHLVLSDPDLLRTLPQRELANGMAEVIKTTMIGDAELLHVLGAAGDRDQGAIFAPELLARCVAVCARIKGRIVERDPNERDRRRVLNLGHTAGHALEAAAGFAGLSHGEAVGLGLLAALRVSVGRGRADGRYLQFVRQLLSAAGLPVAAPALDRKAIAAALQLDKKQRSDGLTFVLPIAPGEVTIIDGIHPDEVLDAIE